MIRKIWNKIKLNEERIYNGDISGWEKSLCQLNDPIYLRKKKGKYVFSPLFSSSLMNINGLPLLIVVFAKITEINSNKFHIHFTAPFRPEHFLILLVVIICLICGGFAGASYVFFLIVLGVWPISHLLSHYLLRAQEDWIVDELTKKLSLNKFAK